MTSEYELNFSDYVSIFRRRARFLIVIFITFLLISLAITLAIPPAYRATGIILVESQQISDNVVSSAIKNQLDEQINVIRQRVMTRENLLPLINKYSLFKGKSGSQASEELVTRMRDRILMETIVSNDAVRTTRQGQQATSFSLSFEDRNPAVALKVTEDLIALFLHWNIKIRTEGAIEATNFLTHESDKLKIEVDRLENMIAEYKLQNKNALPEQLTLRMTMLSRAENDLREVERDYRSTKEELRSLEVELSAARYGTVDNNPAQALPALKAELARLSVIYRESHPDIRRLKYRIESMEKDGTIPSSEITLADSLNPDIYKIRAKIDSDNARLTSLAKQKEMLQAKIIENDRAMIQTPKVAQELDILIRDRDIAQKKFEEFRNKRMNAKIAENLESESQSGRFSVLEPPLLPERPFKPDRLKIMLFGFFLSLASSAGVIVLLESLDKRVRGIDALTHVLGHRPLLSIPCFPVQKEKTGISTMLSQLVSLVGRT